MAASVIGPATAVRGSVRGAGGLEVLGRVEGDVAIGGDVVIAEGGGVKGDVRGASVSVAGEVEGDVTATEAVHVERTAHVAGDMAAPRVAIADGAVVRGMVQTGSVPAPSGPERATSATPRAEPRLPDDGDEPASAPPQAADNPRKPPAPVVRAPKKGAKGKTKDRKHD
jgi:cytoskeletal protein CcmA (bactofilin family)